MSEPFATTRRPFADRVFDGLCGPWAVAALVFMITAGRLAVLSMEGAPSFTASEAAMWLAGTTANTPWPDAGPLLPRLLGLLSESCGPGAPCLRLIAPVAHGIATWFLYRLGVTLFEPRVGFWCAVLYMTAPLVMGGSLVVAPMALLLPFWTLALLALTRATSGRSLMAWTGLGLGLGGGLLTHPAMALFVPLALIYLATRNGARSLWLRPGPYIALLVVGLCLAPDLTWNATHGWPDLHALGLTLRQAAADANPDIWTLSRLTGAGVVLAGPLMALALGWLLARLPLELTRGAFQDDRVRLLVLFSLPVLPAMLAFAAMRDQGAMATAPALPAAIVMVAGWLVARERGVWLRSALVLNIALALVLLRGPELTARAGWAPSTLGIPMPADNTWGAVGSWLEALSHTYADVPLGLAGPDAPMLAYQAACRTVPVRVLGPGQDDNAAFTGLLVLPSVLAETTGDIRARLSVTLPNGRQRAWAAVMVK